MMTEDNYTSDKLTLPTLGDNNESILSGLKELQQPSGAFRATRDRGECVLCLCHIGSSRWLDMYAYTRKRCDMLYTWLVGG